jgi:hypothetical protein
MLPDADTKSRDHRVTLSILLQDRHTVTVGKFPFEARKGAIIAELIRRILEENCEDLKLNE